MCVCLCKTVKNDVLKAPFFTALPKHARAHTHILFYPQFIYDLYLLFWFIDKTEITFEKRVTP
jgi:hypothetical protein